MNETLEVTAQIMAILDGLGIRGVLRVQGADLDFAYLRRWAIQKGLMELLDRALLQAGLFTESKDNS